MPWYWRLMKNRGIPWFFISLQSSVFGSYCLVLPSTYRKLFLPFRLSFRKKKSKDKLFLKSMKDTGYYPFFRLSQRRSFLYMYAHTYRFWVWCSEGSPLTDVVGTFSERIGDWDRHIAFILTVEMPMSVILQCWLWSNEEWIWQRESTLGFSFCQTIRRWIWFFAT